MSNASIRQIAHNERRRPSKISLFGAALIITACLLQSPGLCPVAAAASEAARWTKVNIPAEGRTGNWALAAGSDIRHITAAADGTLYAGVSGLTYSLYRSADEGYSWEQTGNVRDEIKGIAAVPEDARTLYYATASAVYRSTDGGRTFEAMPPNPGGAGSENIEITSIDAARTNANIIAVSTVDKDPGEFGGVYILDESEIITKWQDSGIGEYDVAAIKFAPDYAGRGQLAAAATDEIGTLICVKTGSAGWNTGTGGARLDIPAVSATIAFSGGEDSSTAADFLGYVGIETGTDEGDVYKIEGAGELTATDLNAGSAYGRNDIDITGLAVDDDGTSTVLIAGAAEDAATCTSTDGGETWTKSRKSPTGESKTGIFMQSGADAARGLFAYTGGRDSALSTSRDNGGTWNQISLIDSGINNIIDIAPSPDYSRDGTIFMLTFGSGPDSEGLWRSQNGGNTWERTLSGSMDGVDVLRKIALPPEYGEGCRTVYAAGESHGNPAIWVSSDDGQTYRRRYLRGTGTSEPAGIDAWAIAGETTLFIGSYDGTQAHVFRTDSGGSFFNEAIPAGSQPLHGVAFSPDFARDGVILAGNTAGGVYIGGNTSSSLEAVAGDENPLPFSGPAAVAFDPGFSENHIIYAVDTSPGGGIYRYEIGQSDGWENIDGTLPDGAVINGIAVAEDGTFYAVNSSAGDGMERSLNPDYASGATFETVNTGLGGDATLGGLRLAGHRLWAIDTTNNRLMTFLDSLTAPPDVLSPVDKASAIGGMVDHTVRDISLDWETMDGATGYEWECGYDDDFASGSGKLTGSTSGTSIRLPALEPATTYHWRVRASSPALSPWSAKRSFTTVMDTEAVVLRPESPPAGATGVAVKPVFQWTAVIGAQAYELIVATDAEMNNPVIAMTDEYALPGNVWQGEVSLNCGTTYYWKVRATGNGTRSEWSTIGVFTTVGEEGPAGETPPADHEETTIPEELGKVASLPLAPIPAREPKPTPASTIDGFMLPDLSELPGVPGWIIYLIGILLTIIILALTVILAIVLKIKRVP